MSLAIGSLVFAVICLIFSTVAIVGVMRMKHQIHAPAISGHPMFERAYRIQMNTLEQVVMFLPAFLLAAHFSRQDLACLFAVVWLIGRVIYIVTYLKNPASRGAGFLIAQLGFFGLMIQTAWALISQVIA